MARNGNGHGSPNGKPHSQTETENLLRNYYWLVEQIAVHVWKKLPPGVDIGSLIHSGIIGLLEAGERFEPERGVSFATYAQYRIKGEVIEYLRSLDFVSRSVRSWGRKLDAARFELAGELGREASSEEMAEKLDISLKRYYELEQKTSNALMLQLEDMTEASEQAWKESTEGMDYALTSFDAASQENGWDQTMSLFSTDPETYAEGKDLVEKISAAIENLPERERLVITLYYMEEMTLREIGETLNLTEGRICQIIQQAREQLKESLSVGQELRKPRKTEGSKHMGSDNVLSNYRREFVNAGEKESAGLDVREPFSKNMRELFSPEAAVRMFKNKDESREFSRATNGNPVKGTPNMAAGGGGSNTPWFKPSSQSAQILDCLYQQGRKDENGFTIFPNPVKHIAQHHGKTPEQAGAIFHQFKTKEAAIPTNPGVRRGEYYIFLTKEEREKFLEENGNARRSIQSSEDRESPTRETDTSSDGAETPHERMETSVVVASPTALTDPLAAPNTLDEREREVQIRFKEITLDFMAAFTRLMRQADFSK